MIRVVVADDQPAVRTGLVLILGSAPDISVVAEAADGDEAVRACRESRPDVAVLDVRMPGRDGIRATADIVADGLADVLVLTTFDLDEYVFGALRAGAAGFLLKGVPAEDLQRAVRAVASGDSWLDPAVTGRVLSAYRDGTTPALPGVAVEVLTPRERDVLALIGEGLSNTEIAHTLTLGEGTIKTHVGHIFAKLQLRDRAAAVVFAFDHGLVRPGGNR